MGDSIGLLSSYLEEPPFATEIMDCIVYLVKVICEMEASRGDIARAERSALDVRARPSRELLDAIIFRLAGLTDPQAEGLEQRLSKML